MRGSGALCFSTCSFRLFEEYPLLLFGDRVNYLMGSENLPLECLSEHGGIRILDLFFLISLFVFPGGALREPDLGFVQLKKGSLGSIFTSSCPTHKLHGSQESV